MNYQNIVRSTDSFLYSTSRHHSLYCKHCNGTTCQLIQNFIYAVLHVICHPNAKFKHHRFFYQNICCFCMALLIPNASKKNDGDFPSAFSWFMYILLHWSFESKTDFTIRYRNSPENRSATHTLQFHAGVQYITVSHRQPLESYFLFLVGQKSRKSISAVSRCHTAKE